MGDDGAAPAVALVPEAGGSLGAVGLAALGAAAFSLAVAAAFEVSSSNNAPDDGDDREPQANAEEVAISADGAWVTGQGGAGGNVMVTSPGGDPLSIGKVGDA